MLNFIECVLNGLNIYTSAEPTQSSFTTYHFKSRDEDIHVNLNLRIDHTYINLTKEEVDQFREFKSKQIYCEMLDHFAARINKAAKKYIEKAKSTKGNQQGSTFKLTSDLKLEEV
jgi:hypothetical protein